MRGLWITLVPMMAAAALVLWGGERMARREDVSRIPADRTRLLDFSSALQEELGRIDQLYAGHLATVAESAALNTPAVLADRCQEPAAIRTCHVFQKKEQKLEVEGTLRRPSERVPEVVIEGGKRPFNPNTAIILPEDLGQREGSESKGWITAPDHSHRLYWQRISSGQLVAMVIDFVEIDKRLDRYLTEWMNGPFAPLRESGEFVSVLGPGQRELAASTSHSGQGPAALLIPCRTRLGEWQVQSWDRFEKVARHDPETLAATFALTGILVLLGVFLCIQQNRAIRLAEERVSFVNRVSHELGSPLTNILLNLDLALDAVTLQPQQAQTRLRLVGEEVQRLARLVSNVLTFSRSERKALDSQPQPCVPDEAVEGMLAQFQPSLDRRGIRVEWHREAGETGSFDPDALAQIVGNLISNVEKYAASGGWLGLESRIENHRLRIRVSDHGPGIPHKHQARIFQAFERVTQNVNEGSSGTGLGLAIARDLARRMGGDLTLVPTNIGTIFECDLPMAAHLAVVKKSNTSAA